MATSRPNQPGSRKKPPTNNSSNRSQNSQKIKDVKAEKKEIKEDLRKRIDAELYKLTQDVLIQRISVRDELFGDNDDLDNLRKSMEKFEEEKMKKDLEEKKEQKKPKSSKPNNRPKMDIKLKLIKREE